MPRRLVALMMFGAVLGSQGCGIAVVERETTTDPGELDPAEGDGAEALRCMEMPVGAGQTRGSSCVVRPGEPDCPPVYEATLFLSPSDECTYIVAVDCGPYRMGAACCYGVVEEPAPCP